MASTSASSVQKRFKYDVFLSFRGEDTRKTFVDHLYHALANKGIITYKDDKKIKKGERISEQLMRSIEESRFYIIVFSKNYASSSWCLDELVKIMDCQKTAEQTAYPVFFDVEPTEVRHQSGAVREAFAKHVRGCWNYVLPLDCLCSIVASFFHGSSSSLTSSTVDLENEDDVGRWKYAMKEAASLAGMELKNTFNGHEAQFIQQIVQEVSLKLHFFNSSIDEKLVGMETRVKDVLSSLEIDSDDVRMIGIKGMGGCGKTTLARAVFDNISFWFEGKSFVENVREVSKGSLTGMKELQKQILSDVSNDQSIHVTSVCEGKSLMKKMMCGRKVLVVLDDVDDIDQLEALAGELTWFKPGSRIVITTRDQQVLVAHGVNFIHDVNMLSDEEAICLFSRYAFKREIPNQGYEDLSRKIVIYAAGLPLTIKVLGSHLCGRSEHEWVDAIERLKTIPLEKTLKRLELSYDGLENDQKEIFLDVVCLLKGEMKNRAIRILESCGFNAQIGLRVLEQKSLITLSDTDGLRFHDHIEEMGWNIVRRLHPNTRLWIRKEIEYVLVNKLGTEAIRSIKLTGTDLHPTVILKGLRNMSQLRFLYVNGTNREIDNVFDRLPDTLQFLYWHPYPFRQLPDTFQTNKLVNINMVGSNIGEPSQGEEQKGLNKLRFLDLMILRNSIPELDMLLARSQSRVYEEDLKSRLKSAAGLPSSRINYARPVFNYEERQLFNRTAGGNCKSYRLFEIARSLSPPEVPYLGQLERVEFLSLLLPKVEHLPSHICKLIHLRYLNLRKCHCLRQLPDGIDKLERLEELDLTDCHSLQGIPKSICNMKRLKRLKLAGCYNIKDLPEELGSLECLKELTIKDAYIRLPQSIYQLKGLRIVGSREQFQS